MRGAAQRRLCDAAFAAWAGEAAAVRRARAVLRTARARRERRAASSAFTAWCFRTRTRKRLQRLLRLQVRRRSADVQSAAFAGVSAGSCYACPQRTSHPLPDLTQLNLIMLLLRSVVRHVGPFRAVCMPYVNLWLLEAVLHIHGLNPTLRASAAEGICCAVSPVCGRLRFTGRACMNLRLTSGLMLRASLAAAGWACWVRAKRRARRLVASNTRLRSRGLLEAILAAWQRRAMHSTAAAVEAGRRAQDRGRAAAYAALQAWQEEARRQAAKRAVLSLARCRMGRLRSYRALPSAVFTG
jgi:hypothetical protein